MQSLARIHEKEKPSSYSASAACGSLPGCRPPGHQTRCSCTMLTICTRTYNAEEKAVPLLCTYLAKKKRKNQRMYTAQAVKRAMATNAIAKSQTSFKALYTSETSSLVATATGAGMTVPAIPGHQYCCSRSTPGSCQTISGCFRRRGGALASALSALK